VPQTNRKKIFVGGQTHNIRYRSSIFVPWSSTTWTEEPRLTGEMLTSDHAPINTRLDDGGPWWLEKTERTYSPNLARNSRYEGLVVANGPIGFTAYNLPSGPSDLEMYSIGSTGIARSAPNDPNASLATTIGELRVGKGVKGKGFETPSIPGIALWKEQVKTVRAVFRHGGSEYLNYQFGWAPLVRDVQGIAHAVNDSANIWQAYKKGSDKATRVGYHYPEQFSDPKTWNGNATPLSARYPAFLKSGAYSRTERQDWFAGAFRYHVPDPDENFGEKMNYWQSKAGKILGVRLTPDTMWELAPWSWAIDWFTGTGDLIKNISNLGTDGLVLQYGYAMSTQKTVFELTSTVDLDGNPVRSSRTETKTRFRRIPATPYGFNVDLSTLSAQQNAILVALGLSSIKR
jgi:hypothetical protein